MKTLIFFMILCVAYLVNLTFYPADLERHIPGGMYNWMNNIGLACVVALIVGVPTLIVMAVRRGAKKYPRA